MPNQPRTEAAGPLPLAVAPAERLARLRWVLTDIDDTLTTEGRLPAGGTGHGAGPGRGAGHDRTSRGGVVFDPPHRLL